MINTRLKSLVVVFSLLLSSFLYAQSPDLEFTSTSRGTGNGPVLNSGAFTFLKNSDNPTGTTYAAYTPALTATFSVSNPQYTGPNSTFGTSPRSPLVFGASLGSNATIISNFIGSPLSSSFTASGATVGTGILASTAANSNRGVRIYCASNPLQENTVPTNSTPYMADITITFNRAVNNPILHISGSGGGSNTQAFFGEFELKSINGSASPPASGTLTKLSGTASMYVSGNYIGNSSDANYTQVTPGGANDGSGSVQVNGTGITTLTFKYYLKGAPFNGTAAWADTPNGVATGEALTLSVSTLESDLAITQTASTLTPDYCSDMTFTLTASNTGASNSANTIVNALLPSGYTYVSSTASAGTYDNATGVWTLGTLNDQATATLTITAKAKPTGTYALTSTISGDNIDPAAANNSNTITPAPMAGSSAPVLSDNVANNICPSTSVSQAELNALVLSPTPPGATLVWYTDNTHTTVATFPITANGVYYAFYDFTGSCYTAPSAVTVSINSCTVSNICPATSVNLNTAFSGTAPAGSTLSWHTGTPATVANMLTQPQAGNITTSGT